MLRGRRRPSSRPPSWTRSSGSSFGSALQPARTRMSETYDLFQQGKAHLRDGRAAQATVALEKAKRREPEKASIREALGIAYFRIRRWSEAEVEFRKLVELAPTDPFA